MTPGEASVPAQAIEPRYTHDCEACVFFGRWGSYDLYRCPQGGIPTVVARFSSDGPDYMSAREVEVDDSDGVKLNLFAL